MSVENDALNIVREELTRRFGKSVCIRQEGASLLVQCGDDEASVGVSVDDSSRPSFAIGYPMFDSQAQSWRDLKHQDMRGVLLAGVVWIVEGVIRDGAVLPEFPASGLRRGANKREPR